MTIIIGWAHVGFKYFSFILGMGFPVLSEHPVRHGLWLSHRLRLANQNSQMILMEECASPLLDQQIEVRAMLASLLPVI